MPVLAGPLPGPTVDRPDAGTTTRPNAGLAVRPSSGITLRPVGTTPPPTSGTIYVQ